MERRGALGQRVDGRAHCRAAQARGHSRPAAAHRSQKPGVRSASAGIAAGMLANCGSRRGAAQDLASALQHVVERAGWVPPGKTLSMCQQAVKWRRRTREVSARDGAGAAVCRPLGALPLPPMPARAPPPPLALGFGMGEGLPRLPQAVLVHRQVARTLPWARCWLGDEREMVAGAQSGRDKMGAGLGTLPRSFLLCLTHAWQ